MYSPDQMNRMIKIYEKKSLQELKKLQNIIKMCLMVPSPSNEDIKIHNNILVNLISKA